MEDSGGVVFVPALTGLGAPHWDPHARGLIIGLTRGTTRAHLVRATLEAIAFEVRDVLDTMDTGDADTPLKVDGGASANDLLCQLQADQLGRPVERPQLVETTALGAAFLAGLGVGVWDSTDDLRDSWQLDRRFEPAGDRDGAEAGHARWLEAVRRSQGWAGLSPAAACGDSSTAVRGATHLRVRGRPELSSACRRPARPRSRPATAAASSTASSASRGLLVELLGASLALDHLTAQLVELGLHLERGGPQLVEPALGPAVGLACRPHRRDGLAQRLLRLPGAPRGRPRRPARGTVRRAARAARRRAAPGRSPRTPAPPGAPRPRPRRRRRRRWR